MFAGAMLATQEALVGLTGRAHQGVTAQFGLLLLRCWCTNSL